MHLHLVVPDLFWPHTEPGALYAGLALPAAELLVARGRKRVHETPGLEAWLLARFGLNATADPAIAPFALLGEGVPPCERWWMRADPVHFRVQRDSFVLTDAYAFGIDAHEASALIAALSAHFGDAMEFIAPHPTRWYVSLAADPGLSAVPLVHARTRSVDDCLPQGPRGLDWRKWMNEVQMLLHEHPINQAREARGQPAINSVWPWGAGRMAPVTIKPLTLVAADGPLPRGLAECAGVRACAAAPGLAAVLGEVPSTGVACVVLDALRDPASYADRDAWRARLGQLETRWFAPALAALRGGQLGMVTLHALGEGNELAIESTTGDLRYFWRRRRPLASYVDARAQTNAASA